MKKFKLSLATFASAMVVSAAVYANYQSGYVVTHHYFDENGVNVGAEDWYSDCAGSPGEYHTKWGQITNDYITHTIPCT